MDHLPSTEAAVTALRAIAAQYALEIEVTHDFGADQTSRRTSVGVGVTTDPDGSLRRFPSAGDERRCPFRCQ